VIAAYEGPDSLDHPARQLAALRLIRQLMTTLSYDRIVRDREAGRPYVLETPDEKRLWKVYVGAETELKLPGFSKSDDGAAARRFYVLVDRYAMLDSAFKKDVLRRLFSPEWVSEYRAAEARMAGLVAASKAQDARPFHSAPVPADQRRFAMALNKWCRAKRPILENPLASEQADRAYSRQFYAIVRGAGPIRDWSGILLGIDAADSDASVKVSIDTVSSYEEGVDVSSAPVAEVSAWFKEGSPAYAAASRMQIGQRVSFSGRALEAASEQFGLLSSAENSDRGCNIRFAMELTALRPVP
jgi:hypothetical protein